MKDKSKSNKINNFWQGGDFDIFTNDSAPVLAASTGVALKPVDAALAQRVADQTNGERLQSELFFASLRRMMG